MKTTPKYTLIYQGSVQDREKTPFDSIEAQSRDAADDLQILLTGVNFGSTFQHLQKPVKGILPEFKLDSSDANATARLVTNLATKDPQSGMRRAKARRDLLLQGIEIGATGPRGGGSVLDAERSRLLAAAFTRHLKPSLRGSVFTEYRTFRKDVSKALQDLSHRTDRRSPSEVVAETKAPGEGSTTSLAESIARMVPGARRNPGKLGRAAIAAGRVLGNMNFVTRMNFDTPDLTTVDIPLTAYVSLSKLHSQLYADTRDAMTRVAVWDIGAQVGRLHDVLVLLNGAQQVFEFYSLLAPLPSGLTSRPSKVLAWAKRYLKGRGGRLGHNATRDIHDNTVIDSDFYRIATAVRRNLSPSPDILAGLTPAFIAGIENDDRPCFDFFSSSYSKMVLVSTTDIHKISQMAERPVELAVAVLVIAQVLVAANPRLEFHKERGCLFDEEDERLRFARTLQKLRVEERCLALMRVEHREAVKAMINELARYRPSAIEPAEVTDVDSVREAYIEDSSKVEADLERSEG